MTADDPYDRIGRGYRDRRRPDPRLGRAIAGTLDGAESVVNVGAGTGSYEPADRMVVAVEPSPTMLRQRAAAAAPAVRARAESLPFRDGSFAAALAVLTLHHWSDWRAGLAEMRRVARRRVVLFTWDPASEGFWLVQDYLPSFLAADRAKFPTLDALRAALGDVRVVPVPIPRDCTDGFMGAYWARPAAYLDADVRRAISSFDRVDFADGLARLADDLASGAWERKHGRVLARGELDLGYRLVVASGRAR